MRRPMIFSAIAFAMGITIAFWGEGSVLLWIIMLQVTLAFFIWNNVTLRRCIFPMWIVLSTCFFFMGGIWLQLADLQDDPLEQQVGSSVWIQGIVETSEQKEDSVTMTVRNSESKILVKYYGELCPNAGCTVRVHGEVQLPQQRRNPNCFDYRLYLKSCGIRVIVTADSIEQLQDENIPFLRAAAVIRSDFSDQLDKVMDKQCSSLVMAMLFGDKSSLDEDLYEEFQQNGTAHVLAVSGLHVGILYGFFVAIWKGRKGTAFYITIMILLLFYMTLADFSPSVVRAGMMIMMHIIANLLKRRYDMLSAGGFVFLMMLIRNPFQLFHTGFQLSFLAIVSLAVLLPFVKKFYQGIFLSSIAIQMGMTPYTAFVFNYISIGSIFANIPIIFLTGILLPIGLCLILTQFLPESIFRFTAKMMEVGCELLVQINSAFYKEGATSFSVCSPPVWSLVLYYGIAFFLFSESGQIAIRRANKNAIMAVVLSICIFATGLSYVKDRGFTDISITFVDVGQGDCIHVRTDEGKNFLIDGGGSVTYDIGMKTLKPYLLKNGVRKVEAAFVTHLHEDHYGGIRSLAADGMVDEIGVYEANAMIEEDLYRETKTQMRYLYKGQTVRLGKNVDLDILAPSRKSKGEYTEMLENQEDENRSSLIFRLNYNGVTVLLTGDIDADGEKDLVQQYGSALQCDILKVAHHGSKGSSSDLFLDAVAPQIAIFQVGKNNYGHPSDEVIEKFKMRNSLVLRNDQSGAIGIKIDKERNMSIVSMIH